VRVIFKLNKIEGLKTKGLIKDSSTEYELQDVEMDNNQLLRVMINENRVNRRILVSLAVIIDKLGNEKNEATRLKEEVRELKERMFLLERMVKEKKVCECKCKRDKKDTGSTSMNSTYDIEVNDENNNKGTSLVNNTLPSRSISSSEIASEMPFEKKKVMGEIKQTEVAPPLKGWSEVVKKPRLRKKVVIGSRVDSNNKQEDELQAGIQHKWIFIGKTRKGTKESDVISYIKKQIPDMEGNVICSDLGSKGLFESFRVGVNKQHAEKIMDAGFWPKNILVKDFLFRRPTGGILS